MDKIQIYTALITSGIFYNIKNDFTRSTLHARVLLLLAMWSIYKSDSEGTNVYTEHITMGTSLGYFLADICYMYKYHKYYLVHHLVMLYTLTQAFPRSKFVLTNNYSRHALCEISNPFQNNFMETPTKINWVLSVISIFFSRILYSNYFTYKSLMIGPFIEHDPSKPYWFKDELLGLFLFTSGNFFIFYKTLMKYKTLK